MKLLATAVLVLAAVALVVGWRATAHHEHCDRASSPFACR